MPVLPVGPAVGADIGFAKLNCEPFESNDPGTLGGDTENEFLERHPQRKETEKRKVTQVCTYNNNVGTYTAQPHQPLPYHPQQHRTPHPKVFYHPHGVLLDKL